MHKGVWNNDDLRELLARFEFPDAEQTKSKELREYLFIAISDNAPSNVAEMLLECKHSDFIAKGQIDNLSHEMLCVKSSETYIYTQQYHYDLFNINQSLYNANKGRFLQVKVYMLLFFRGHATNNHDNDHKPICE